MQPQLAVALASWGHLVVTILIRIMTSVPRGLMEISAEAYKCCN